MESNKGFFRGSHGFLRFPSFHLASAPEKTQPHSPKNRTSGHEVFFGGPGTGPEARCVVPLPRQHGKSWSNYPIGSIGLLYLPRFAGKINQM